MSVCDFVEVRGGVRPVQRGSSARAQCPQLVDADAAQTQGKSVCQYGWLGMACSWQGHPLTSWASSTEE